MTEEQFRHFLELADKRDEKRYAFLRHLLLLATGALTILVSLKTDSTGSSFAVWSLRLAWPALGLGILLLALALYGDIWTADALVRHRAEQLRERSSAASPSVATRPRYYVWCERAAYAALATTVVALVCHGIALTW
jgi:hypothetical protein